MNSILTSKPDMLEEVTAAALKQLLDSDLGTEEYGRRLDQIVTLYALKKQDASNRVSKDVIWTVVGNLAGIGMILSYEHARVITSKAFSLILKPR